MDRTFSADDYRSALLEWERVGNDHPSYRDQRVLAALRLASKPPLPEGEAVAPVAWRVKDFADGWMYARSEDVALTLSKQHSGALIQPLYVSPPSAAKAESAGAYVVDVASTAYDGGAAAERAAIVAWLRRERMQIGPVSVDCSVIANAIEAASHLGGKPE